jgi:hypothetical protein
MSVKSNIDERVMDTQSRMINAAYIRLMSYYFERQAILRCRIAQTQKDGVKDDFSDIYDECS